MTDTADTTEPRPSGEPDVTDHRKVIADLEEQLRSTPRAARPYEHATLAFRLGLALAEAPAADPAPGLRKALALYEMAGAIFDPRHDPVEHGRVLNMAGAAHRGLGDRARAAALFEKAIPLLEEGARDDEIAAVWNNLGLVRGELGQIEAAIEACDRAVSLFDSTTPEGRRGKVAALHSRGNARAAAGADERSQSAALVDFAEAAAEVDVSEAPYHYALVQHSIGVTCTTVAALRPSEAPNLLRRAATAFAESLSVFSRTAFPYQHALAKHNLGRALSGLGGDDDLRYALACFEDAVAVLDPTSQRPAWQHALASMQAAEAQLETRFDGWSRTRHFVALVLAAEDQERRLLLRDRLTRYLDLSGPQRVAAFSDLALVIAQQPPGSGRTVLASMLSVLIELPPEGLEVALRAVVETNRRFDEDAQADADRVLDQAVSDAVVGPQRVWVRDFLYSIDWERP